MAFVTCYTHVHDEQKETVWQRTEFHLNIKMFHTFKDDN
jgi:hypothetical protein